jgi:hypothetical protein
VTGEALRDMLLQFGGNMFLAVSALMAVMFLVRREFVRFAEFAALAVLVATFVFVPEVWVGVGRALAGVIGADTAGVAG